MHNMMSNALSYGNFVLLVDVSKTSLSFEKLAVQNNNPRKMCLTNIF